MTDVGRWIRARRQALGLTLDDVEAMTGVSKSSLIRLEQGTVSTRISTIEGIIKALGGTIRIEEDDYVREADTPIEDGET